MIACRIDVTTRNGSVVASVAILDNSTGSLQQRVEAACAKLRRDYPTSDYYLFRNYPSPETVYRSTGQHSPRRGRPKGARAG